MKRIFFFVGFLLVFIFLFVFSVNYVVEVCGDVMGGVGVVLGNFFIGFFYNLVLVVIYCCNDDVGMILLSIGLFYNDFNDFIIDLDKVFDIIN